MELFSWANLQQIFTSYEFLTTHLCTVLVVVGMDAELDESWVNNVNQTEDRIVSQWREVSANEKHEMHDKVDKILRRHGLQTRLLVVEHANSLVLYFICMTLSAVMSLRDQWSSGQLRGIVQELFTFLSHPTQTIYLRRLTWPLSDYQQCLKFFSFAQGQQANH